MHMLGSMKIVANKEEVLSKLRGNRAKHATIVAEARDGYLDSAMRALEGKMKLLANGKIVSLAFGLSPPQDHTNVYDTAIKMLELHTEPTVILDAAQVRNLMMDEWDWKQHFLASNSAYSATAAAALGGDEDIDS